MALHHVGQRVIAGDVRGARVDAHHEVEAFGWRLQNGLGPNGSGVIDQDVEPAEFRDSLFDEVADGVLVADIGGDGQCAAAQGVDGCGGLVDAAGEAFGGLFAFGGHHHIGALAREADGQVAADATAGSRHHGDAASQVGVQDRVGCVHTFYTNTGSSHPASSASGAAGPSVAV